MTAYPGPDRQITPVEWYNRYKQKMEPELNSETTDQRDAGE